jgi:hypothetical protein
MNAQPRLETWILPSPADQKPVLSYLAKNPHPTWLKGKFVGVATIAQFLAPLNTNVLRSTLLCCLACTRGPVMSSKRLLAVLPKELASPALV